MSVVPIDWRQMQASIDRAATRVAELLRSAPDGTATVSGLDWSVSDLGAHLINEADRFDRFGRGKSQPLGDVVQINADEIASVAERDPAKQADLFLAKNAEYLAQAKEHEGTDPYTWFDIKMEWAEAASISLGELSVHAVDLGRTLGRKVTIPSEDARLVAYGLAPILPGFVNPDAARGFTASYKLKLRGGESLMLSFDNGVLSVGPANGRKADCTISADPASFLLVGYGRASQWGPIMRGKIMAGGRKPWLGLKFASLLVNP